MPPHNLKPYKPLTLVDITVQNADAFAKYFGDRVETMRELASEGHTGHMYLDEAGHAVSFIWGTKHDYFDRHYYRCMFPVKPGEFFEFGGELTRRYWGTCLSVDLQLDLWRSMREQGCDKVVDVCETHNIPALKLHKRMGYTEQGRVTHVYGLFRKWRFSRVSRYKDPRLDELCNIARAPVAASAA
ncbi:hypothetical protein D3C80_1220170 [compost metagenome]